jgi:hypothetical protein
MIFPVWTLKLAAAAVIPVAIGVGGAISAPSPVDITPTEQPIEAADVFVAGPAGVDYALITGPRRPADTNAVPACNDPVRRGDLPPC